MTKIQQSVTLDAPLKNVFIYVSDWEKWTEWFEGVSNFEPTTNTERGNGTKYKYKAKLMGFTTTIETEIHEFTENKGWTGVATLGMPHKTFWEFEEYSGKTRFTYGLEYKLPIPIIGNLLDSLLMKPQWDKLIKKSLQNLKRKFSFK